eukprot:403343967
MGAACGCMKAKVSKNQAGVTVNKKGVQVGAGDSTRTSAHNSNNANNQNKNALSREEIAQQRAAVFEQKKRENQARGLSREAQIEIQMKQKRLDEAAKMQKSGQDFTHMKW